MNFYTLMPRFQLSERETGLYLVKWTVETRNEHADVYRRGDIQDYRNKEVRRIISGLEEVIAGKAEAVTAAGVLQEHGARLGAHRDIVHICFLYDVVRFYYQRAGDGEGSVLGVASFVGERFLNVARGQAGLQEYQRVNETPRSEFSRMLGSMKNGLNQKFGVVLHLGR